MEKLSNDFLNELFGAFLKSKSLLDITSEFLGFEHLPSEEYKKLWEFIKNHHEINKQTVTFGMLYEEFKNRAKILSVISKIKKADVISAESALEQLEVYLKKTEFVILYNQVADKFQKGDEKEAYEMLTEGAQLISDFSLRAKIFEPVFGGFEKRYNQRILNTFENIGNRPKKCITGIDSFDRRINGGVDKTDTFLILARSGVGKSTFLRWIGYVNARMGNQVLHIQLEGKKEEVTNAYDTMFAGGSLEAIESTSLNDEFLKLIINRSKKVSGEIFVIAFEQFGSVSLKQIRQAIINHIKNSNEYPDAVILDYLDKAEPGNGKKYSTGTDGEKARKQALADGFKNICLELNLAGFTATQASNVPIEIWNDPSGIITRADIKGDKNMIDPFSYVLTLNQTLDEKEEDIMRIFEDKVRKYPGGKIHHIITKYNSSRFYDAKSTLLLNKHLK